MLGEPGLGKTQARGDRGRSGDGERQDWSEDTDNCQLSCRSREGRVHRERVGPVQETLCRSAGWKGGRDRLKREPYTGEDGKAPGRALILFFEGVYPHVLSWGRGTLLALGTADTLDCPVRGKTFTCISGVSLSDASYSEQTCHPTLSNVPRMG